MFLNELIKSNATHNDCLDNAESDILKLKPVASQKGDADEIDCTDQSGHHYRRYIDRMR